MGSSQSTQSLGSQSTSASPNMSAGSGGHFADRTKGHVEQKGSPASGNTLKLNPFTGKLL